MSKKTEYSISDELREGDDGDPDVQDDFKKIINQCDQTVVNSLMPFIVNILDCMNSEHKQKLEYEAKLYQVMKDNLTLQNREKHARKILKSSLQEYIIKYETERESKSFLERKLTEYENTKDKEGKTMKSRLKTLEVNERTLEKKFKMSTECIGRLQRREANLKKEYFALLERYTQLFKEHIDYLEKSKDKRLIKLKNNTVAINETNNYSKFFKKTNKKIDNYDILSEPQSFEEQNEVNHCEGQNNNYYNNQYENEYNQQYYPEEEQNHKQYENPYEQPSTNVVEEFRIEEVDMSGFSPTESITNLNVTQIQPTMN